MWLLSTARAELHFYVSPEAVQGGYAILSHVWDVEEQTLQDLQELRKRCSTTEEDPRNLVCEKIKRCCELAESHGFEWVWIDTCCIDKTSSAELSEAINSMFQYYSLAGLCYAYLKDVPTEGAFAGYPVAPPFQQSRWHTRGWTLQELIAPRTVIFLSCDWVALGSKVDLAASLELRTGIPADLLRLQRRISDFSVAQRMSWAAYRTTTRVEDEAYSLLGIFDIMMPTLYGEGRKAFRRLQEEIMRQSADPTLFAWGVCIDPLLLAKTSLNGQALSEPQSYERESRLFAYSPGAFSESGRFTYTSHFSAEDHERDEETSPQSSSLISRPVMDDTMTFAVSPSGVLAHIPVADLDPVSGFAFADLGLSTEGDRLLLILLRRPHTPSRSHPAYHVCARNSRDQYIRLVRIEAKGSVDSDNWRIASAWSEASWKWTDVYLLHNVQSPTHRFPGIPSIPMNHSLHPLFRFPDANIQAFMDSLRSGNRFFKRVHLASVTNVQIPVTDALPLSFVFSKGENRLQARSLEKFAIVISVGQCAACNITVLPTSTGIELVHSSPSLPNMWAHARSYVYDGDIPRLETHDCGEDHVSAWPGMTRSFACGGYRRKWESRGRTVRITLSFTPCPLNSGKTMVLVASADIDHSLLEPFGVEPLRLYR